MAPNTKFDQEMKQDIADMKASLNFLCKTMDDVQKANKENERKFAELLQSLKQKDEKIEVLEQKVDVLENSLDEIEQYSRKKNIIVTGINLHSYAKSAEVDTTAGARKARKQQEVEELNTNETATMRKNFVNFAKTKLNVEVDVIEITAIHDLPRRKDGTQPIIVQMMSNDRKTELMQRRGQLRGTNIYLNDHLSPKNSELFREARRLKREKKCAVHGQCSARYS